MSQLPFRCDLPLEDRPQSVTASSHTVGLTGKVDPSTPVIALVGAPNTGKSTLFNALTGCQVTMGNWPGTTVEVSRGVWRIRQDGISCSAESCEVCEGCPADIVREFTLVDLPGTYSLDPNSPDEQLTRDLLSQEDPAEVPDLTVVIVDAGHLARSLYLVSQIRERALRVAVALTMIDVATQRNIQIDPDALSSALGCPVVAIDPRRRTGIDNLARAVLVTLDQPVTTPRPVPPDIVDELAREDERFAWINQAVTASATQTGQQRVSWSDRIDRWVTAPVLGPIIFLSVMWLVFQSTTSVAAPLQDFLDGLFAGPVSHGFRWALASLGLNGGWLEGLLVDGLVAGVGMLLTFVPLMTFMFLLLALLEDSGYLARAAVVSDRLMGVLGLPGKAFLPLIVGFGCNVPAISATRILGSARQRILTALLVPFTSCTARLTVYVLVGTTFFGTYAGTVVFGMYLLSICLVVAVGLLLRRTLWRTMGTEPLVIDLPPYQLPTLRLTASVTWVRLRGFLQTASGIIVAAVCLVWLFQSIPARGNAGFGEVRVEDSAYAVAAQALTPVFAPTGFASWETTSALVVGFVAKEAVISSWAQTYAIADDPGSLGERIIADFAQSSGGHPLPAVAAFLVFLLAYTPCVATLAAQLREIGWRWTAFSVALQMSVAWVLAVAVFQTGRLFW